jgi:CRP-like cAMP-binding protein
MLASPLASFASSAALDTQAPAAPASLVRAHFSHLNERSLTAREPLFREGDETRFLFEVLEGVMCNYKIFADGRRQVISFAFPGELVGFGHGDGYRFDCDALSQARVLVIPKASFLATARERPELGERLLDIASEQVAGMQEHSMLLGRKTAAEKIATFLVDLAERSGQSDEEPIRLQLAMTRADIADYLGLTVETVSRNITKLKVMRIVSLPNAGALTILDLERLQDLAESEELLH